MKATELPEGRFYNTESLTSCGLKVRTGGIFGVFIFVLFSIFVVNLIYQVFIYIKG